ncbi:hypothetical protein HELRODRAFT_109459 [Helobdella robusta]|uniref:GRAM domain-containing protein n=1 Tax=Helobdella robusta TaxID=6412 RepID=T1EEU0_HELRO|nr:hypothetical protein HELRODRAFT_109459 [Helobdella robusta]ESO10126.1 hypothetical protein HELRODRAFT_109459 [Helobdella robusta]
MSANKNSSSKKDDLANLDSTQIATKTKAESVMSMVQSFEHNESFLVGQGIKSKSKAIHSSRSSDASSHHTKTLKNNQTKQETKRRHVIGPTFKSRNDDFHKIFTSVSPSEKIISDYSCALQMDILFHGRMYISENHLGFYVYLFRKETKILIKWIDVIKIKREKTAKLIPNAILLVTHSDKYCFTSLAMRDKTFLLMRELWQNSFSNYKLTNVDLWLWRYYNYGDELGLNDEADSNRLFSRSISHNDGSSADCKKISSSPTIYDEGADDSLRFKVTALDRSQFYCRVQKQLKLLQLETTNKIVS